MSEVRVNKLSPRSGTTVTLGDSGDTITIPSGVTLANSGTFTNFQSTGIDDNATSTAITIDSSQRVGIGSTAPSTDASANANSLVIKKASGNVGMSIITDGSSNANIFLGDTSDSLNALIQFNDSANELRVGTSNGGGDLVLNSGAGVEALRINDTGNVGIGTSSPGRIFEVSADQSYVSIKSTNDSTGTSQIFFGDTADDNVGRINYQHSDNSMLFLTSASERMRIDSSGNVLVGSTSYQGSASSGTGGQYIGTAGQPSAFARNSANVVYVNRIGSDGSVIGIRKNGADAGSIGTAGGGAFYVSDAVYGGLGLSTLGAGDVNPCDTLGAARDNAMDLGQPTARFKDLYLSQGVFLGGTGTANKLDDYEEGTWTPTYTGSSTTGTSATGSGQYTKIGNLVHVDFGFVNVTTSGAAGDLRITGLPFTVSNTTTRGSFGGNVRFYNHNLSGNIYYQLTPVADGGTTYIVITETRDDGTWTQVQVENSSGLYIEGGITYTTTA